MSYNLRKFVQEEIDSGVGDIGRLQFILDSLNKDKTLYQSDRTYLEARISKHAKKMSTLKNETENVFKNNENQNNTMTENFQDYNTKSGQDQQTTLFLNKSEMTVQTDIQKTLLEVRKNLENVLERIEKLERDFLEGSKFEPIASEVEQNYLSNELHDFTEKSNNTKVEFSGKNKNKQKMDKNLLTISKILIAMTIATIVPTLVILWFFGTLEGKLTWQNHEITYLNVSAILHSLLYALILVLMAWPAFGILSIINKRTKINHKL